MEPDETCSLCGGGCHDANLDALLSAELLWLWEKLAAAADRRGDPHLTDGSGVVVRAPDNPAQRAAAVSMLGGPTQPGQQRTLSLPALTSLIQRHGARLTPGAVAAHAVGRPLAQRALRSSQKAEALKLLAASLTARLRDANIQATSTDVRDIVDSVRKGALTKLLVLLDPEQVINDAVSVLQTLPPPGRYLDRRLLAQRVLADPHGLDEGRPVEVLARALLVATGQVPAGARPRIAWSRVGVKWDEISGGISVLGIHPQGWSLPSTAVATIPPIELTHCRWPSPSHPESWAFVTENPSVLTAARRLSRTGRTVRLLCTSGTPSEIETAAIAGLTARGWELAVRADFDESGLRHVQSMLNAAPTATPWRMTHQDYLDALDPIRRTLLPAEARLESPWDPELANAMQASGAAVFEESLLSHLLDDLAHGRPGLPRR
jgi:uncharacterized protein (TIGR02679 family)